MNISTSTFSAKPRNCRKGTSGTNRGSLAMVADTYWRRSSMRKVALIIGLASILSFPAFAEDLMLGGTYKLVSSTRKLLDTGEVIEAYGKHPTGYVNYGKDGRFLVLIVSDKNDRPNPESVKLITDQQRADLFRTMTSYGGTYTFDGHTLAHHV